jgi:chaperonin GroES
MISCQVGDNYGVCLIATTRSSALPKDTGGMHSPQVAAHQHHWQHISTIAGRNTDMASKIKPVGDRVVVRPSAKEEMTSSGLIIPDTAKEKPQEGTVIAVGAGKLSDKGDRQPLEVKEGDRVLFAKYGGTEFKLDGEDLLVLRESDILAILEDKK